MKLIPIFVALCLLALGCTEIEYRDVEKLIRDTVRVKEYVDRVFVRLDTVKIPVNVPMPTLVQGEPTVVYRDSIVYVDRVDSVFIETLVYLTETITVHDTTVVRDYIWQDTLVVYGGRTTYQVPSSLQPILTDFYIQAQQRGYSPPGGLMTIEVRDIDKVLQAYSFDAFGPTIIVNGNQTIDEMYLPIMRELARQQLGKEYSQDPTSPMFPFFPSNIVRYSNRSEHKSVVDQIFK